jgi:hypothetical protein
MSSYIANEVWQELKRFVNHVDRAEAAEILVSVLIDNDIDAEEIKTAFKGDSDIKRALTEYLKEEEEIEEDDEEYDHDEDY